MFPEVAAEPLGAVVAEDQPEFQRPEPAAEGDVPVAVVEDLAGFRSPVLQVFGRHRERPGERAAVAHPEGVAVEVGEQPLVGVETVGVGELHAGLQVSELGTQERGAGHGGVHMEPQAVFLRQRPDLRQRIERAGPGGSERGGDEAGDLPGRSVGAQQLGERLRAGGAGLRVRRDRSQVLAAEAGDPDRLQQRRVRFLRAVGDERRADADPVGLEPGGAFPGGEQGGERRRGGGVLDHAAAGAVGAERRREVEEFRQPVEDQRLQFRRGRAGRPEHPVDPDPGGEQFPEHRRPGVVRREEPEETGVLPVEQAGHDDPVEVGEDRFEGLAPLRRMLRQERPNFPRTDGGRHREAADPPPVVGQPVEHRAPGGGELLR